MKILLAGINAKYVQTNLAIRLLKVFAEAHVEAIRKGHVQIEIGEWNINQPFSSIVRGIFESRADMIVFSTYIWNRDIVFKVAGDVHKVMPKATIGLGGPEVSWSAMHTFRECPDAKFIIAGEGEITFKETIERFVQSNSPDFSDIPGLYYKKNCAAANSGDKTEIVFGGPRALIENLDIIPFPYVSDKINFNPANKIVYFESSRGCPFSCAYCLSSIDKTVRYYPLDRVLKEIGYFMEEGFPLVKFVDRTFNLDPERYLAIWTYIRDHHNGRTLFHFEIAAEYLSEETFSVLETLKEGTIQFEIGIQSINTETLKIVGRPCHPDKLAEKIKRIPRTIHIHVDLIAGLPAENLDSFARSFNFAFALNADMLQVGFLKVLAGSPMAQIAGGNPGFVWSSIPPYEILTTPSLSYEDLLLLKDVEHLVDGWFNSGLMRNTLNYLSDSDPAITPFMLFINLASFCKSYFSDGDLYLPRRPADSFRCMAAFLTQKLVCLQTFQSSGIEYLRYDYLLQGKPGVFPEWYERRYSKEIHEKALEEQGFIFPAGVSRRLAYSRTEYDVFFWGDAHERSAYLFIYPEFNDTEKKVKILKL